jgi:hypothetical protein
MRYRQKPAKKVNELNRDWTDMDTPITPGAQRGPADQDHKDQGALRVGAVTSQSEIDKIKNTYGVVLGASYVAEQTGWDGLTKEQEAALIAHNEAQRQLEAALEENEERYQQTVAEFERQKGEIRKQMKAMEDETLHLRGKAVFLDEFGRPAYADGTLLDGQDKKDVLARIANGEKADSLSEYQKLIKNLQTTDQNEQDLINKHDANRAAGAANIDKDKQDILDAQEKQKIVNEAASIHEAKAAAIADATTTGSDSDDDKWRNRRRSSSQPQDQSAAAAAGQSVVAQASRTSYASGLNPSSLSSKGAFTVATAATVPVSAVPDVTQENIGSSQRNPATPPSPTASV